MMDYEKIFGGPAIQAVRTELDRMRTPLPKEIRFEGEESPFLMHHALNLFYANGGGSCYIVSAAGMMMMTIPMNRMSMS
jgi:uncharacterized protein